MCLNIHTCPWETGWDLNSKGIRQKGVGREARGQFCNTVHTHACGALKHWKYIFYTHFPERVVCHQWGERISFLLHRRANCPRSREESVWLHNPAASGSP